MAQKIKTRDIKQKVVINALAQEIYDVLMSSKGHSELTGSVAKISSKTGGKFTAYDGYIKGVNLELVPGQRIVQEWRAEEWPEDHYSTVIFDLREKAGKTTINFLHKGVPDEFCKAIEQGWEDFYWAPLKSFF